MSAGRKSSLTNETMRIICNSIANGLTNRAACGLVGIHEATLYKWLAKGEKALNEGKSNQYSKLYTEVRKAESTFIARRLSNIKKQADEGKWQADAWLLERRFPQDYGRQNYVELSGNTEKPVEVEHSGGVGIYSVMLPDNGRG